jgi:Xaa-Pro aminopeptidase
MRVWSELQGRRRLTLDLIQPGMRTGALYEKIQESHLRAGEPPKGVPFAIHGIGLSTYEAPFIAKGLDEPLQAGMVLGVEHAVQRRGLEMKVKDVVAITEEGRKLLSDFSSSDELFRIGKEIGPVGTSP